MGTTSACAENTELAGPVKDFAGNYLRVRGEYIAYAKAYASKPELPPRARRIPEDILAGVVESGTTSACAENTQYQGTGRARCRNYLRVRGEYTNATAGLMCYGELPPRARRIRAFSPNFPNRVGTTSACAENTPANLCVLSSHRNYLRVRGEYSLYATPKSPAKELPPRARRIHGAHRRPGGPPGTTSACAENTPR